MIEEWLNNISLLIENNFFIAPFLALIAGLLTSLMPCSLSSFPLIIAYVGGTSNDTKKSLKLSLVYAVGSAVTFTILGVVASLLGNLMGITGKWWYIVLGVLMILMALQVLEIFEFIPSTYLTDKTTKKGYVGALIAGILGGIFSSPCATPVLVVLLAIVAGKASLVWGIVLLLMYSIGYSILIIFAGISVGTIRKLIQTSQYGTFSIVMKYMLGSIIAILGIYMLYLGF